MTNNNNKRISSQLIRKQDDLLIHNDENILVIGFGCDQTIISILLFAIEQYMIIYYNAVKALETTKSHEPLEDVNRYITYFTVSTNTK